MKLLLIMEAKKISYEDLTMKVIEYFNNLGDNYIDMHNGNKELKCDCIQQLKDIDVKAKVCKFMVIFLKKSKEERIKIIAGITHRALGYKVAQKRGANKVYSLDFTS